jgi:hypothetical protein
MNQETESPAKINQKKFAQMSLLMKSEEEINSYDSLSSNFKADFKKSA